MVHSGGIQDIPYPTASLSKDHRWYPQGQAASQTLLVFGELESAKLQPCSTEARWEHVWDSAEELLGPSCLPQLLSGEGKDNVLRQSVMDGRASPETRR